MKIFLLLTVSILGCGEGAGRPCKPQEVAIADCLVKEYDKNPSPIMLDWQRRQCNQRYPYDMCYYYD